MALFDQLISIAPPPAKPIFTGTADGWMKIENDFGFIFPDDYKQIVNLYGYGRFAGFVWVANPFYNSSHDISYSEFVKLRLEGIRLAQATYPDYAIGSPVFPERDGLFPWGFTDNGDTLCWEVGVRTGQVIVCLDSGFTSCCDRFPLTTSHFLFKWLNAEITVQKITPFDFFPLEWPVFQVPETYEGGIDVRIRPKRSK
jgi:SMI1-KNR4 cell-wall